LYLGLFLIKIIDINRNGEFQMPAENADLQMRQELEAKFIAKAWEDEKFKQDLINDPKGTYAKAMGAPLPANIEVRVLEETPTTYYLVIPANPEVSEELSDEALEAVAGGYVGSGGVDVIRSVAKAIGSVIF
jgi:Nitrile hydratase, alpha chain